ncbi:hypothetical protein PAEAM_32060 [Paenibacillus sp. GM1FR]|nr:hypothetical protein [Paenibacillus sp. GM1FR]PJN58556.1 hypothetical protein PAEAM_32060 [Paenibacillus sp. GM1FR]
MKKGAAEVVKCEVAYKVPRGYGILKERWNPSHFIEVLNGHGHEAGA